MTSAAGKFVEFHRSLVDGWYVEIKKDDEDYLAFFFEKPEISAFGPTPHCAIKELNIAWNAMKESYRKHGDLIPQP